MARWFGQKRRAIDALTSATRGRPSRSPSPKSRPSTIRMPTVAGYPARISRTATSGCSDSGRAGSPSIATGCIDPPPASGSESTPDAACTPGTARTRASARSKKRTKSGRSGYVAPGSITVIVTTLRGSMPGSTARSCDNVRIRSPAATSSISASATSVVTSTLRTCRSPACEPPRPMPCLSASPASPCVMRHAGATPATMPVAIAIAHVNARTRPSSATSPARGSDVPNESTMSPVVQLAARNPTAPPASASTVLSTRSCWMIRPRPAPTAARIASSRARPSTRAKSRFARFAQAISSTHPTAPSSTSRPHRTSDTMSSRSGRTTAPQPLSSAGYSRSSRCEIVVISACARRTSTSGRRRPITRWL